MAAKFLEACAERFSDLEITRMEYLIDQKDYRALDTEIQSRIDDPATLLEQVAQATLADIKANIAEIAQ